LSSSSLPSIAAAVVAAQRIHTGKVHESSSSPLPGGDLGYQQFDPPSLAEAIAPPVRLLKQLLQLADLMRAPRTDFALQQQLADLSLGVFPFVSQRCAEVAAAFPSPAAAARAAATMLPLLLDIAPLAARIGALTTSETVLRACASAVADVQGLAVGALMTRLRGLPALRQREVREQSVCVRQECF
jgi:hypothetical protein